MNNKKTTVVTISATLALILLVATATFAYFQADLGNNKEVDVSVSTLTENDRFSFAVGDPLALQADETSFVKGGDSVSDTTNVKAMLTAGGGTAIKYYYVYLLISGNDFIYTQDENTPELILTITSPDGTELTTLDGLTYKTVADGKGTTIKGFDITTKKGLITIANNKKITTTSTIEEQWDVTVTLVNYDVNQIDNIRKSFTSKLLIQQDEYPRNMVTECQGLSLSSCVKAMKGIDTTLYYHDSTLTNGAGDNSYRYAGTDNEVNNYICLGSDDTVCPDTNLFRIIGVFDDQLKVISAKSLGTKEWNSASYTANTWSTSSLKTYLNGTYLTNLTFKDKIATTTWIVGGNTSEKIGYYSLAASTAYQNEIISPQNKTTYDAKVGLMYVSDFRFSAPQIGWSTNWQSYAYNSWMFLKISEWTITRNEKYGVYYLNLASGSNGVVISSYDSNSAKQVNAPLNYRPVFYLLSTVAYASGTGTSSDPIRINYKIKCDS